MHARALGGPLALGLAAIGCGNLLAFDDFTPPAGTGGMGGSSNSSSTSSSSGGGSFCVPESTQSCYDGLPASTRDVGPCHAGVQVCKPDGSAYGECVGQVKPVPEDCTTPADDDCDGVPNQSSAGCVCLPGAKAACYTGPAGTEGVGICVGGLQTCNALGTAFGSCDGEALPHAEDCTTKAVDESCDGVSVCTGQYRWGALYGAAMDQIATGVAADPQGDVVVVGWAAGAIDFGGQPLAAGMGDDIVIAKLDPSGKRLWSKRFGGAGDQAARGVAVDPQGNIVVVGDFAGTLDLGDGPVTVTLPSAGAFVLALDSSGNHLWSKTWSGTGEIRAEAVAVDTTGGVFVTGLYNVDMVNLGGLPLPAAGGHDVFIAKLDATGEHVWSHGYGNANEQVGNRVAVDSTGDVVVCGNSTGNVNLGGAALPPVGTSDAFLAKYKGSDGTPMLSLLAGQATKTTTCAGLAVGKTGSIWFTGSSTGTPSGAYLNAYDPATSMFPVNKAFAGTSTQGGTGLAVDDAGNVVLVVPVITAVDFGSGSIATTGAVDVAIAKFDPGGGVIWARGFGGPASDQVPTGVAVDAGGNVFVAGYALQGADFGGGTLASGGGDDMFVTRLAP
jgi:hypothetical protein